MDIFLSAAIILPSLIMAVCLYFRHVRNRRNMDLRVRMTVWVFVCEALLVTCDMAAGGEVSRRLPLDLLLCIIGLAVITSSVWEDVFVKWISEAVIAILLMFSIYFVLASFGWVSLIPDNWIIRCLMLASCVLSILHFISLCWRIRDVHAVMKAGTVWQCLSLSVDCIYVMLVVADTFFYVFLNDMFPDAVWHAFVISVILAAVTFALGVRVIDDSLFIIFQKHERRIVESMKISQVEVVNDMIREDDPYRDIYERVAAYFDESLPYLNSELTINDVVKVVFTNKLYISRAISQYTGRNFCQFVNYHRVTYSVGLFRRNPDMKIMELANASGFNTVASFSMAFKLFMNENPSDWCRKERMRLIKGKNKLWNP